MIEGLISIAIAIPILWWAVQQWLELERMDRDVVRDHFLRNLEAETAGHPPDPGVFRDATPEFLEKQKAWAESEFALRSAGNSQSKIVIRKSAINHD